MREVQVIDTTLRDAPQSLWATRMTTAMMLPVAERMDRIGFHAIDLMGAIQFDVAVRYLKENPWERLRLMRQRVRHTPLQCSLRSKNLISFAVLADDILALWIERLVANGARRIRCFDALCDLDNITDNLRLAKRLGAETVSGLVFSQSPVHTDEFYARKARESIERAAVDVVMIKDSDGLLTIDRIRTLVPAMKAVMGDVPLELHSHCMTGLAPIVYLEGVKMGVDQIQTSIAPLANGAAQPATQSVARNLRRLGYPVTLDEALIDEVSAHFTKVAAQEGKPLGTPVEYDVFHYEHQMPGGMLTNFHFQLQEAGLSHKYDEVLHECARVREELGWAAMVSPFSQLVGTQAVLNILHGRYRIVPDEVVKYVLGHYGKPLAPIDPQALDRIMENGSKDIRRHPEPLPPALPGLRKRYPHADDEELLLRSMYAGGQVDAMLAAGPMPTTYTFDTPLLRLLQELANRPTIKRVFVQTDTLRLEAKA